MTVASGAGDFAVLKLKTILYTPEAPGPFPLLICNHGPISPRVVPVSQTLRWESFGMYSTKQGVVVLAPIDISGVGWIYLGRRWVSVAAGSDVLA